MTGPPPDDLRKWSKNDLVREVRRLRAVTREHSERTHGEARPEGAPTMIDPEGDPYARGGVIMDARGAVILDTLDVALVDTMAEGESVMLAMSLAGRANYSDARSETLYLMGEDGAAAVVSELIGLAARIGPEFLRRLMERVQALP